jgi:hypothetical protein
LVTARKPICVSHVRGAERFIGSSNRTNAGFRTWSSAGFVALEIDGKNRRDAGRLLARLFGG